MTDGKNVANKRFIGITGTTSVGKSAVAVKLAQKLCTFVISADSMQVYEGMNIGTAKVTADEMCGVPHYMLDVVEPDVNYSSFEYAVAATKLIENAEIPPIVAGGTGFYFDSLLYPSEFGVVDEERRKQLQTILATGGGFDKLCKMLVEICPNACQSIDMRNPKRVLRALEIAESGGNIAEGVGREREPKFDAKIFVLQRDRTELYRQIDLRVDKMIANGLVDEVKALLDKYGKLDTTAFSAIGYKEVIEYLTGNLTLTEAVEQIKLNTRHYAKRQITYFKRMKNTVCIDVDDKTTDEVVDVVLSNL